MTSLTLYAVIGAGGHGRETMPIVDQMLATSSLHEEYEVGFVVEDALLRQDPSGPRTGPLSAFLHDTRPRRFTVAIADPVTRRRLAALCMNHLIEPFTVTDRTCVVRPTAKVGVGAILSPYTVIGPDVRIGTFFHGNTHSNIAHDCVIGDFVTFAPGVLCNGHVVIGDNVQVGAGAVIRNGALGAPLTIGDGAVIGMGSVVLNDVPAGVTVVGNPARPLRS